ncbi:hypothetical protein [Clostridium coskatii]|uniref:Uncharacterized protein n=1 Tax=Clostridium coskatii TaxID=1705578 RepID=A0A162L9Q0_9CLOT|nr:hypothetical protein [Clostridium coskatii]OAA86468.1 hypothetical protein WX73_02826 [Clostridium coskatii]OBR92100.1 hypothetical protein CLCOS_32110 [Clostridium coskatii]
MVTNQKEQLRQELEEELQWVKYRQQMLDIMDKKLLKMREIAKQAKQDNLDKTYLKVLNDKINDLGAQVRALDGESRKTEDEKIL